MNFPMFSEILAAGSMLAALFLAGRYVGILEAKIKNGKSTESALLNVLGRIEQKIDDLLYRFNRGRRGT